MTSVAFIIELLKMDNEFFGLWLVLVLVLVLVLSLLTHRGKYFSFSFRTRVHEHCDEIKLCTYVEG